MIFFSDIIFSDSDVIKSNVAPKQIWGFLFNKRRSPFLGEEKSPKKGFFIWQNEDVLKNL
ncbi:MAG: hypothetical protein COS99_08435 [Candidatus Omnitrophica bacterium CG07_land_8_20_14_0_80_42_15]|uniref:Uncharacterized protein n=1 Tax=Candidatus Aquitaenariimonas noxiae TaxID=1974741 RepID=A0A2J0KQL9_9BACT|nr:MAG: hypothetical protein COS99_08435 [Candidatus Omnitrophica bacterium CG07_land_8_20_14_0_80_42_15]